MSFINFCKRSLAAAKLAVTAQLEYRFNFAVDAIVQPILIATIEMLVWYSIFASTGLSALAGFDQKSYLAYALWAAFFARISTNWMYEHRMISEIDTGSVNSILVRPISFYEFYLGQFMGYKLVSAAFSLSIPIMLTFFIDLPTFIWRLPLAFLLVVFYLVFVHTLSFCVATSAFFFNRTHGFTAAKNIAIWVLAGEIFPLDMAPEPFRSWMIALPFSSGVFVPVGYLVGRVGIAEVQAAFVSVTISLIVVGFFAYVLWWSGRRVYSGTGA